LDAAADVSSRHRSRRAGRQQADVVGQEHLGWRGLGADVRTDGSRAPGLIGSTVTKWPRTPRLLVSPSPHRLMAVLDNQVSTTAIGHGKGLELEWTC
jgi:hypothetical protein